MKAWQAATAVLAAAVLASTVVLPGAPVAAVVGITGARTTQPAFEPAYRQWLTYRHSVGGGRSDVDPNVFYADPSFAAIVDLGPAALPYLVEAVQGDHMLGYAIYLIAKTNLHIYRTGSAPREWSWRVEEFPDIVAASGPPDYRILWQRWWDGGQSLADWRFESLYGQWRAAKSRASADEASGLLVKVRDIGLPALPPMIEKVSTGEAQLLPVVQDLTSGAATTTGSTPQERTQACVAWWNQNKAKWLIPFPDQVALTEAAPATGSPPDSSGKRTVAASQEGAPSSHPAAGPVPLGRAATGVRTGGCGMRHL